MDNLGIELISAFGLPPVHFVELAGQLKCRYISAVLEPLAYNPEGYAKYSLRNDRKLRREMVEAMAANGVSISLGEGFVVRAPGANGDDPFVPGDNNMRDRWAADLEVFAELGVKLVNAVCVEKDLVRGFDQLGLLAELAAANDIATTVEFCPGLGIGNLATALQAVHHVGRKDFGLLMDPMHLVRSGGSPSDVAVLAADLILYAQLCDVPLTPSNPNYIDEAMNARLTPGTGELPLLDYLAALPDDIPIGLEVPQSALAEAGVRPRERIKPVVEGARRLLARVKVGSARLATAGSSRSAAERERQSSK